MKKGKQTIKQPAASLSLKLAKAYTLAIEPAEVKFKPEGKQKIQVKRGPKSRLHRGRWKSLSKTCRPASRPTKTTIPADQSSVEVELAAAKEAKPATANNVTAEGQATQGNAKFAASSAPVTVTIEAP